LHFYRPQPRLSADLSAEVSTEAEVLSIIDMTQVEAPSPEPRIWKHNDTTGTT
jgi:hypothetical protein